ncbi:MAG TPA: DUF481 domain-containing protein [Polyangiaceae bacterium]
MRHSAFAGFVGSLGFFALATSAGSARADDTNMGKPPADATALVAAPTAVGDAPKTEKALNQTVATLSAGGQYAGGNSRLFAATVNGKLSLRREANGFGAEILGNYGEGALPGADEHVTTENLQGRLRYDRYMIEQLSLFALVTGRHDRFQGLDFRLNLDPGVKYLFVNLDTTTLWAEAGYDFQWDDRRDDSLLQLGPGGVVDPAATKLDKYATDHSARLFVGFKHAFNKDVTFNTGLEYLQSLIDANKARVNYDALLAAGIGGGFSFGVGFSARFDNKPLPGKSNVDTVTTFNLIYSFSDAAPAPPTCPCPEPAPPPPPPPPPPPAGSDTAPPAPAAPPPAAPPPPPPQH